jgi:hypothetical protein
MQPKYGNNAAAPRISSEIIPFMVTIQIPPSGASEG